MPLAEHVSLFWEFLPYILAFVSLFIRALWPAALIAFVVSNAHPIVLVLILGCLALYHFKDKIEFYAKPKEPRFWIHLGLLVGLSLTWPSLSEAFVSSILYALIPFLAIKPMYDWHVKNSGGSLYLTPFLMLGWLKVLSEPSDLPMSDSSVCLACMFIYLMLLMAWYRQIPIILKVILLACSIVASVWVFSVNLNLCIVFVAFILYSTFDKWLWGRSFCLLQLGTWFQAALITLAMILSHGAEVSVLHLCFSLGMVFLGTQEVCRLCVASAKCREVVLSWWVAKSPLLYLLLILLGISPGVEILLLLCFTSLSQEVTRSLALKPIKIDDVTDSTCKEDFVEVSLS